MPDADCPTRAPADADRPSVPSTSVSDGARDLDDRTDSHGGATGVGPEQRPRTATAGLTEPTLPRRARHGVLGENEDLEGIAEQAERGSQPADEDDAPRGRHGGHSGGLSASELIARAQRAAARLPNPAATPVAEGLDSTLASSLGVLPSALHAVEELLEPEPLSRDPEIIAGKSRAGRNLPAAIAVGLGLGSLAAAALLLYRPSFVALILIAVAIGSYEMVTAIATVEARAPVVPILVGGTAMVLAAWHRGPDGLVGGLLLTTLGVIIWRVADGAAGYRQDVAAGALIALYVPFLAGFAALLARPDDGAARVLLFIVAVACSDTGGFVSGVLFGKHPMAPMVSPKKSWEGFIGSLLGAGLAGALIMDLSFHHTWWKGAIFGVAIAVVATLGDLGESMIKRDLALKDMGKLLPGHGGMMDRLDSLLPCAPVAYLLFAAILPS